MIEGDLGGNPISFFRELHDDKAGIRIPPRVKETAGIHVENSFRHSTNGSMRMTEEEDIRLRLMSQLGKMFQSLLHMIPVPMGHRDG